MINRLTWAAIVVLATYLTFIGGGWLGIYSAPLRIVSVLAAGAGLACWIALWRRHPAWRPRSVLMPAIAAALASLAISTAFSRVPRMSLEYLAYAILLAALYLLLVRLMAHEFFARRLLVLGAMFFVAVSVAFLVLVVAHWIDWWRVLGGFAIPPLRPNFEGLTYLNPSAVLTMAALFAVPAVALANPSSGRGRIAIGVIVVVLGVVAFLTGSRAGWLAIALTMVVGVIAGALDRNVRAAARRGVRTALSGRAARVASGLVLAGGVLALLVFAPAIARRLSEGGEDLRAQYAVTALRMFASSPIVGTGPGSWVIQQMAETADDERVFVIPHAHNLEVQTLAEEGLVGAGAGLVLVVALGQLVLRAIRDTDPFRRRLGWLTFLGLAYFAFHQVLDFYANMPAALFAAVVPVAWLDATSAPAPLLRGQRRTLPRFTGVAAGAIASGVLIAVVGLLFVEVPASRNEEAVRLADGGDWASAAGPAREAANADAPIGSYGMTAGLAASRAGDHQAAAAYFRGVAERDDLPEAWVDLAAEQLMLGRSADARASLERAFRLGRQRAGVSLAVGDLALRASDNELAIDAFAAVLSATPTVVDDAWWSATPARIDARRAAIARLEGSASSGTRWRLAVATGEFATARSIAAAEPDGAFKQLVLDAWQDQEPAIESLIAQCYASPLDPGRLILCGQVAAHLDQGPWVADMRELLEVLGPGLSNDAGVFAISDAPAIDERIAGRPIPFWGVFTYRRSVPANMIVPGVAQLVLR